MHIKEIKNEKLRREYEVSLPVPEIDAKVEKKLEELASTLRLDGFRPGKIPLPVVRQRYGASARQEAIKDMIQKASDDIVKDYNLNLAIDPTYDVKQSGDGKDVVIQMNFEVFPPVEPITLEELEITQYKIPVNPEDLEKSLKEFSEVFGETVPVEEKRKTRKNDVVTIDFEGRIDGTAFLGGTAKGHQLLLGSGSFIPGFEDQLLEKSVGDDVTVSVTFPENYTEPLAGKKAEFLVKIHAIQEKKPRPIDEDLGKKAGFESLDALKKFNQDMLEMDRRRMTYEYAKQDILEILANQQVIDLPPTMVEREYRNICHRLHHYESQDAHHESCHGESFDKKCESWRKEYFPIAERRVKLGLILGAIAKAEHVKVRNKDLESAIIAEARNHPEKEREIFDYYKNTPQALEALRAQLLEEKTIRYILEKAKVTEKLVSLDEFKVMMEKREEEMEKAYRD